MHPPPPPSPLFPEIRVFCHRQRKWMQGRSHEMDFAKDFQRFPQNLSESLQVETGCFKTGRISGGFVQTFASVQSPLYSCIVVQSKGAKCRSVWSRGGLWTILREVAPACKALHPCQPLPIDQKELHYMQRALLVKGKVYRKTINGGRCYAPTTCSTPGVTIRIKVHQSTSLNIDQSTVKQRK